MSESSNKWCISAVTFCKLGVYPADKIGTGDPVWHVSCVLHRTTRHMRLTTYTDFALRTLMHLAAHRDRLLTIQDIAELHNISKNHLTKVVHFLGQQGLVTTIRGRSGGLKLGKEPEDINIGAVVRLTETDFHMAECFMGQHNQCVYSSFCILEPMLAKATQAFLAVLDSVTLDQLVVNGMMSIPGPLPYRAIPIHSTPKSTN